MNKVVLAVGAHPDDIEFACAGTLLQLRKKGWEIHMWNLANGSAGSKSLPAGEIAAQRWQEAQDSARILGAKMHPPLFSDLGIFYDAPSLARVSSVVRAVNPAIILTHPPSDYMEDHENTCRLMVTAAIAKGIPNYQVVPSLNSNDDQIAIYHTPPLGCQTSLNQQVWPSLFVDIESVIREKVRMLMAHESQMTWLEQTQSMASLEEVLLKEAKALGAMSGSFGFAEAFIPHQKRGYSEENFAPLEEALKEEIVIRPGS